MAEPAPPTGDTPPSGTPEPPAGDTPPAPGATPPNDGAPATNEGDTVTLPKKDYDNLVSQRDRANNAAKQTEGQQAFVEQMAQERAIGDFLKDNAKTFPDVTPDDLSHIWDPEQLKPEAERIQRRLQDHAQQKLMNIEQSGPPVMSAKQREERLKELKKGKSPNAFDQMVELRMSASS